jgi:hypothetical protein
MSAWITVKEAGEISGINHKSLYNACKAGRIAYKSNDKGTIMLVTMARINEAIAEGRLRIGKKRKTEGSTK